MKSRTGRFVVVSSYFPPIGGGASLVITNLLRTFAPEDFRVIAEKPDCFDGTHDTAIPAQWRVDHLGVPPVLKKLPYGNRIIRYCRFGLIPSLTRRICKRAREINAECILAVFPSWPFYIAAYYAHRRLGIPLYTYHLDALPKPHELKNPDKTVYRLFHERILRAAKQRLVLSAALEEDFKREFGLDSKIIPHSLDLEHIKEGTMNAELAERCKGKRLIVHTGAVAALQMEGLLQVAKAVEAHPELNAKLVLSTPSGIAEVIRMGFDPKAVEIVYLKKEEVFALQRFASALLVVLPFTQRSDERTPFPTKTVEYMASGTPILAYIPADSFLAGHIAQYGYALTAKSESELPEALASILNDHELQAKLTQNALHAVEIFSLPIVANQFSEACGLDGGLN